MGKDNNNAGIHAIPKGYRGPSEADEYDKYAEMIAESDRHSILEDKIISDVRDCNFIILWDKKGKYNECKCKCAKLKFSELEIKYHKTFNTLGTVYVSGKTCPACGRMYVVRDLVIEAIRKQM